MSFCNHSAHKSPLSFGEGIQGWGFVPTAYRLPFDVFCFIHIMYFTVFYR